MSGNHLPPPLSVNGRKLQKRPLRETGREESLLDGKGSQRRKCKRRSRFCQPRGLWNETEGRAEQAPLRKVRTAMGLQDWGFLSAECTGLETAGWSGRVGAVILHISVSAKPMQGTLMSPDLGKEKQRVMCISAWMRAPEQEGIGLNDVNSDTLQIIRQKP